MTITELRERSPRELKDVIYRIAMLLHGFSLNDAGAVLSGLTGAVLIAGAPTPEEAKSYIEDVFIPSAFELGEVLRAAGLNPAMPPEQFREREQLRAMETEPVGKVN